jgi:hypothetical protein
MEDKHILILSIITAIIGIIALFIIMQNTEIKNKHIALLNNDDLDKKIKLNGKIISVNNNEKITIVKLETIQEIDIIIFENLSIKKNNKIEVIGTISEYNKKYQINAESIRYI